MAVAIAEAPLVLVIDDQKDSRDTEVELVRNVGCVAIGVATRDLALLEASQSPYFDAALCDVNLTNRPHDKSGVKLARELRKRLPNLKIVGYSAYFSEGDLSENDHKAFDRWYRRADDRPIEMAEGVKAEALIGRAERGATREIQLDGLRKKFRRSLHGRCAILEDICARCYKPRTRGRACFWWVPSQFSHQ